MAYPNPTASGSWAVGTGSPNSPTLATHAAGDLLLVEIHSSTNDVTVPTHSTPSGWTLIGSATNGSGSRRSRVSLYARKALSGAESNPSFTVTPTGATVCQHRSRAHTIATGTWLDTGTLTDAWEDVTIAEAGDSSILAFSGFATIGVQRLAIASVAQADDTATGITNNNNYLILGTNHDSATGTDGFSHTASKQVATAGDQSVTFTFTAGGVVSTVGILFALLPSPAQFQSNIAGAANLSADLIAASRFEATAQGVVTLASEVTIPVWIDRDIGFPKIVHQTYGAGSSLSTSSFDVPSGGRLLIATAIWSQGDPSDPGLPNITDNQSTSLNWTLVGSSYWSDAYWPSYIRIWVADAPDAITGLIVTTTVVTGGNRIAALNVDCIRGAGLVADCIGAVNARVDTGSSTAALQASLTAQAANSWVHGAFLTGNTDVALTADGNTTGDDNQEDSLVGCALLIGHLTNLTTGPGSATIGTTYGVNPYALWVAVEILKVVSQAAAFTAISTGNASIVASITTAIEFAAIVASNATLSADLGGQPAQFQSNAVGGASLSANLTIDYDFQAAPVSSVLIATYIDDERPVISPASGVYSTARTVTITKQGASGMTIRYTTDGSRPTISSTAYSGSFQVSATGIVRAAIFSASGYKGPVATAWYVIEDGATNLIGPQHTRVIDGSSKLLSWLPQSIAFGKIIERISDRLVAMPLDTDAGHATGFPQFLFHSYLDASLNPAGNWASAPGGQIGMMLDAAVAAYPYTGNGELMKLMKMMLAYLIKNGSTPATGSWQRAIYNEADPDEVPFIGAGDNGGGVGDGQGNLEPDKQAEIGWGALQLWMHDPTQTDFRDLAIRLADQLCANRKTSTSASVSPWPFRTTQANNTRPSGAGAGEDYCSNLAPYIRLFDDLIRLGLGSTSNYQTARNAFWTWATTYPLSGGGAAGPWGHYFEDQPWSSVYTDDANNLNPNNMARLLLERPSLTASYLTWAANLAAYVETTFGDTAVYGAVPINEQDWYMWPMGSHTSRAGLVRALLYAANSSETDKDKAFRALNWTTYMHRNDGFSLDGYPTPNQIWMTDGFGDTIRHFALAMYAVPEWAPAGEDHLLGSTSVVQSIHYHKDLIEYQVYDVSAREVLRLSFTPTLITAGGTPLALRTDLNSEGYTWDSALKILRIRHDNSGTIIVLAGAESSTALVSSASINTIGSHSGSQTTGVSGVATPFASGYRPTGAITSVSATGVVTSSGKKGTSLTTSISGVSGLSNVSGIHNGLKSLILSASGTLSHTGLHAASRTTSVYGIGVAQAVPSTAAQSGSTSVSGTAGTSATGRKGFNKSTSVSAASSASSTYLKQGRSLTTITALSAVAVISRHDSPSNYTAVSAQAITSATVLGIQHAYGQTDVRAYSDITITSGRLTKGSTAVYGTAYADAITPDLVSLRHQAAFYLTSQSHIVQLELLEFSHPNFTKTYRIVRNAVAGVTAKMEDGSLATFDYYPLRITQSATKDNLDNSLKIDFGDLGGVLPQELDAIAQADGFLIKPTMKYWCFRSDDLQRPLLGPVIFEVENIAFTQDGASFEAKAPSLNINKTGENYNLSRFPMLRGFI